MTYYGAVELVESAAVAASEVSISVNDVVEVACKKGTANTHDRVEPDQPFLAQVGDYCCSMEMPGESRGIDGLLRSNLAGKVLWCRSFECVFRTTTMQLLVGRVQKRYFLSPRVSSRADLKEKEHI